MARRQSHTIALLTALVAVLAVGLVGALTIERMQRSHHTHDHPELDMKHGLLVTTRSEFRVCVQADASLADAEHRAGIERHLLAALERVRHHPHWQQAYGEARYDPSSVLTWGCPAPRLPQKYESKFTMPVGPGLTADPSPYRIWIYVLDEAAGARILGPEGTAKLATAESMTYRPRSSFPVSIGLLIREAELADTARAAGYLTEAAGLAPV